MKKISPELLANAVTSGRKALKIRQIDLAKETGINRAVISLIENGGFTPSANQLMALSQTLNFDITSVFSDPGKAQKKPQNRYNIAVAGTGYVGLSLAVLLAQHNDVTAVDIIQEKVDKLNSFISPIQDEYIETYLKEAKEGKRELSLTATTDGKKASS